MPLTNCSDHNIDEITFSQPRNTHCTVKTPDIRTVTVKCEFNSSITGYQAILQAIDINHINTLVIQKEDVIYPLQLKAKRSGFHSVTVFPIMGVKGIVFENSEVVHRELIYVTGAVVDLEHTPVGTYKF